jgi:hypothetical protein
VCPNCHSGIGRHGAVDPVFNAPGKGGRKHADDLRSVVDAML